MEERNEISVHEVRVFLALKAEAKKWRTSKEIGATTKNVAARTVRGCLLKFVKLGLADQAELFPGHRYRLSEKAGKRNVSYMMRLEKAAEIFGDAV